jgi:hypothetical protein
MALFNTCEAEIKYIEIIKEVPVEIIVEVPVYDDSEINKLNDQLNDLRIQYEKELSELNNKHEKEIEALNNSFTDSEYFLSKVEELNLSHQNEIDALNRRFAADNDNLKNQLRQEANIQLEELKSSYEEILSELTDMYNAKIEELHQANIDIEIYINLIDSLNVYYKKQIETLHESYNAQITKLHEHLTGPKEMFMLRVYQVPDNNRTFNISNHASAKSYLTTYMTSKNNYPTLVENWILRTNQLEVTITEWSNNYVNKDVDSIINDINEYDIAYGFYRESVTATYVIVWFIIWMF